MLKPAEPGPPPPERPIGELFHQLIDDGKAYAQAEVGLIKAIANAKAKVLIFAAALIGTAALFALAGIAALSLGAVLALEAYIGPLAAGFVGLLIFVAIAGGLGWYGVERVRREL
jgi:Putative Actinobacterial Holin-X, holin superfamily III